MNKIILRGMMCCAALLISSASYAQDVNEIWSPAKLMEHRMEFIEDFQRIGMNTTPDDARFLRIMILSSNAKRGVEIGTANGYGAIHMGMAFEQNGGELITIDINADMVKAARENIDKVRLGKTVKVIEGDALEEIPKLEGKFDFVFLDALKSDYFNYFKLLLPMLEPGAVVVADNVIQFEEDMEDFLNAMRDDPHYDMQIIKCSEDKEDGMAVIYCH